MRYYENIVLDKCIKNVNDLKRGFKFIDYYAVCVSEIGKGIMEIISVNNLFKDVNRYKNYGVVAVVKGKFAAENFVAKAIEDWLKNNNSLADFKSYYNLKCK